MKKVNFLVFAIFFLALVVWIGAFTWMYYFNDEEEIPLPPSIADNKANLANPASVFCKEQGGRLEIIDEEVGQAGYCAFGDGRVCEEWAFFRNGDCIAPE